MIDLAALLQPHGLEILGTVDDTAAAPGPGLVLVGNRGSSLWPVFSDSPEYRDGAPDPLDRWSRRVGLAVAEALGAGVVFPFDGPPWPPFLEWARLTGRASPSPISMFIHHEYGLWHAYRFALQMKRLPGLAGARCATPSPCLSCRDQPCLEACPVGAFSEGNYRVDECVAFLESDDHSGCRGKGCRARRACPVAAENRYLREHAKFHMDAFLNARLLRDQTVSEV